MTTSTCAFTFNIDTHVPINIDEYTQVPLAESVDRQFSAGTDTWLPILKNGVVIGSMHLRMKIVYLENSLPSQQMQAMLGQASLPAQSGSNGNSFHTANAVSANAPIPRTSARVPIGNTTQTGGVPPSSSRATAPSVPTHPAVLSSMPAKGKHSLPSSTTNPVFPAFELGRNQTKNSPISNMNMNVDSNMKLSSGSGATTAHIIQQPALAPGQVRVSTQMSQPSHVANTLMQSDALASILKRGLDLRSEIKNELGGSGSVNSTGGMKKTMTGNQWWADWENTSHTATGVLLAGPSSTAGVANLQSEAKVDFSMDILNNTVNYNKSMNNSGGPLAQAEIFSELGGEEGEAVRNLGPAPELDVPSSVLDNVLISSTATELIRDMFFDPRSSSEETAALRAFQAKSKATKTARAGGKGKLDSAFTSVLDPSAPSASSVLPASATASTTKFETSASASTSAPSCSSSPSLTLPGKLVVVYLRIRHAEIFPSAMVDYTVQDDDKYKGRGVKISDNGKAVQVSEELPHRSNAYVSYKLFKDLPRQATKVVFKTNTPHFDHAEQVPRVFSPLLLRDLRSKALVLELWDKVATGNSHSSSGNKNGNGMFMSPLPRNHREGFKRNKSDHSELVGLAQVSMKNLERNIKVTMHTPAFFNFV